LLLAGPVFAQQTCAPMNNDQARHDAKVDAKEAHHADKAQAKADKAEAKALGSKKVKKAARKQDKANAEAERVPQ
jgi:hypothetical protein